MTRLRQVFDAGRCDDDETLTTIADVHKAHGRLIDPHTAVGVHVARAYLRQNAGRKVVTLSTAHPAKFEDAVFRATGRHPPLPPALAALRDVPEHCAELPNDLQKIKEHIRTVVA
jgi:threonine synthase